MHPTGMTGSWLADRRHRRRWLLVKTGNTRLARRIVAIVATSAASCSSCLRPFAASPQTGNGPMPIYISTVHLRPRGAGEVTAIEFSIHYDGATAELAVLP